MEIPDLRNSDYARKAAADASEREAERRRRQAERPAGQERWYLAREARRFVEDDATLIFDAYGVQTYTPKFRKLVPVPLNKIPPKHRRNGFRPREERLVALFPGFLLMKLDFRRDDWREIFDRARLCGIIGTQENGRLLPRPIPQQALDEFQKREKEGLETVSMRDLGFAIGDAVGINDGYMSGYNGVVDDLPDVAVEAVDEDIRIRLLIKMFGRLTPVEIPLSHIEKL